MNIIINIINGKFNFYINSSNIIDKILYIIFCLNGKGNISITSKVLNDI